MRLDDSTFEVSTSEMTASVGSSGGKGLLALDSASALFKSTPTLESDWSGSHLGIGTDSGSQAAGATGEVTLTNDSELMLVGFGASLALGVDGKANAGKMTVSNGSKVHIQSSQEGVEFIPRDQNNENFGSNAGLVVGGADWESPGGTGSLVLSGEATEFLIETSGDASVPDVKEYTWIGVGSNQGSGTVDVRSGASFLMNSDGYSAITIGNLQGKGNLSVEDALWVASGHSLDVTVGMYGGAGTLRLDNATVVLNSAPTPSADYDWTATYVRVGGVGWDGKDSSSIGDALITNGTQLSVVGRHSGIAIGDGKGSKSKMVVDNGAKVLLASTDANNEYATENQGVWAFLTVGGSEWENTGGEGLLEISGAGTEFRISSQTTDTVANADINIATNGISGVLVVKSGAELRVDNAEYSWLRMSIANEANAKEGISFLQITDQDSVASVGAVYAGRDNQASIDVSNQGQMYARSINIQSKGILMGDGGMIASSDPSAELDVLVDGRLCVGDQLQLDKKIKTSKIGSLEIEGAVEISQVGKLEFDINQTSADKVNVGGYLDINGTVTVNAIAKLATGTRYLLATADSIDLTGSKLVTVGTIGTLQLDANATELYFVVA